MTSLAVFRPRLQLHKECISVNLDAADLISHGKARARAVEARCLILRLAGEAARVSKTGGGPGQGQDEVTAAI
eukprot:1160573-Pelagomonas_calceolata.AAC.33